MNRFTGQLNASLLVACAALALSLVVSPASAADGKATYLKHCMGCHQAGGSGIPGIFPPLANNSNLADKPAYIAEAIIKGVSGPLEVNGKQYNGAMPALSHISNEEISAIANYIVNDLENGEATITPAEVQKLR